MAPTNGGVKDRGNGNGETLAPDDERFLDEIARTLGHENINALTTALGYKDHQGMADHYGFKNLLLYFTAPGGGNRYLRVERHFAELRKLTEFVRRNGYSGI